jgi:hypothetical protein
MKMDFATGGSKTATDQIEQGGFARPIGTNDGHALTCLNRQINPTDDLRFAKLLVQVAQNQ